MTCQKRIYHHDPVDIFRSRNACPSWHDKTMSLKSYSCGYLPLNNDLFIIIYDKIPLQSCDLVDILILLRQTCSSWQMIKNNIVTIVWCSWYLPPIKTLHCPEFIFTIIWYCWSLPPIKKSPFVYIYNWAPGRERSLVP